MPKLVAGTAGSPSREANEAGRFSSTISTGSRGEADDGVAFGEPAGVIETSKDIRLGELRVPCEDVGDRVAGTQKAEDRVHGDASPANDRASVADFRVQFDAAHRGQGGLLNRRSENRGRRSRAVRVDRTDVENIACPELEDAGSPQVVARFSLTPSGDAALSTAPCRRENNLRPHRKPSAAVPRGHPLGW